MGIARQRGCVGGMCGKHVWETGRRHSQVFDFMEKSATRGKWRRGRDSNPRTPCRVNGFRDRRNRPLCHLSASGVVVRRGFNVSLRGAQPVFSSSGKLFHHRPAGRFPAHRKSLAAGAFLRATGCHAVRQWGRTRQQDDIRRVKNIRCNHARIGDDPVRRPFWRMNRGHG